MNDLDFLSIVILKNPLEKNSFPVEFNTEHGLEKGIMTGSKFISDIEQIIGIFNQRSFKYSFYHRAEMEIKETKHHYYMKITGFFFLHKDYNQKLTSIFITLGENKMKFHLTRLDSSFTWNIPFQTVSRLLMKVRVSHNITKAVYEKKNQISYFSCFNSRFSLVCYDKQKQIKAKKKKDQDYRKLFFHKYGLSETRMEFRIKSKAELSSMTLLLQEDPETFLNSFAGFSKEKAKKRLIFIPKKLKPLFLM